MNKSVFLFVLGPLLMGAQEKIPEARKVVDFVHDVHPFLARMGCNAAACHGAALGQKGFRLSLFGGDAEFDYESITHEFKGRRIDRAVPERSLILRKPLKSLPHGGGKVFDKGSAAHDTLLAWLNAGVPYGDPAVAVERISAASDKDHLSVRAEYTDGTQRDVTSLATYASNDEGIVTVTPEGTFKVGGKGETTIMVRYEGRSVTVPVFQPFAPEVPPGPRANFIDDRINERLVRLGLPVSPRAGPEELLRRVTLDLVGRLPTLEETTLDIEALLASPEFNYYWGYRFAQFIGANSLAWLTEAVAQKAPWNAMVAQMLGATGKTPAAGFLNRSPDPKVLAEQAGQAFLGTRWGCAQCHDHPFERFTQEDYYGVAAFFARVRHKDGAIELADRDEITFPGTTREVKPAFPGGKVADFKGDRRAALISWLPRRDMARAFVNRAWALLMGRGIVHPVDDFRSTNPPTHPELLDDLAAAFINDGWDLRKLLTLIVSSEAYRRSAVAVTGNAVDDRYYSRARSRPLSPAVFADCVAQMSGEPASKVIRDGTFSTTTGLARALEMINGTPPKLADTTVEGLYLRAFARKPTAQETAYWQKAFTQGPRQEILEDLLWAIVNSNEFGTNH